MLLGINMLSLIKRREIKNYRLLVVILGDDALNGMPRIRSSTYPETDQDLSHGWIHSRVKKKIYSLSMSSDQLPSQAVRSQLQLQIRRYYREAVKQHPLVRTPDLPRDRPSDLPTNTLTNLSLSGGKST